MTSKEAFIKYFSLMDAEMIDLILNDSYSYNGSTKIIFSEKIRALIERFTAAGDTELNIGTLNFLTTSTF